MSFNRQCAIPSVYCGTGKVPKSIKMIDGYPVIYLRKGTPYECLQKGFGTGSASEKKKNLSPASLQNIKYIGSTHETKFRSRKVATINALVSKAKNSTSTTFDSFLRTVLVN